MIDMPVSYGELLDKITILRIKSEKISDPKKLLNINKELSILLPLMEEELNIGEDDEKYVQLHEINKDLWKIEDEIREKERKKEFDQEFIEIARSVYIKNDERSKIKKKINLSFGSGLVEEKSYEEY